MGKVKSLVAAAALSMLAMGDVRAADYPDRPIQVIVPLPAGGPTDLTARLILPYIEKYMPPNSRFIVINKPGAGGEIGLRQMINSKPDGYTIALLSVPNVLMKAHERPSDWNIDSFVPVALLVYDPAMMATRSDKPYNNAAELIAAARKEPGKITVASSGVGSNDHLTIIALQNAAGIKFHHISFDGGAPARNSVLGGHTELYATTLGDALAPIRAGQMKPIGIVTKERLSIAKEVPTFLEQGIVIEGAAGSSARGLIAPKGTPQEAIDAIAGATEKALKDPELVKKSEELGLPLRHMGTAEYGKYLQDANQELAAIWKRSPWVEREK